MVENREIAELDIDVVAERPLVPVTRFEDDGRVGVEWLGRCWAWLEEGEPPALVDVVVKDGEVVKLLEPGHVRRVRARALDVESGECETGGFEIWMEFGGEPPEDRRDLARGLFEGGMVRVIEGSRRNELRGKIGKLLRFPSAVIEVGGRGHLVSIMDLEPMEEPGEPTAAAEGEFRESQL